MHYQSDYVLRLIEQMGGLVRAAIEALRMGGDAQSHDLADRAIGLATGLDPLLTGRLSPTSLANLVEMNNLDDRVIELIAEALQVQAEALESGGELVAAEVKRQQAASLLALLDRGRAN